MSDTNPAQPQSGEGEKAPEGKQKRRYSRRLKKLQKLERGVSKAMHRLASSVDEGLRVWRKGTDESARKRKDGAIRDALKNYARAASKQLRIASWVPIDLAKALPEISPRRFLARVFLPIYK